MVFNRSSTEEGSRRDIGVTVGFKLENTTRRALEKSARCVVVSALTYFFIIGSFFTTGGTIQAQLSLEPTAGRRLNWVVRQRAKLLESLHSVFVHHPPALPDEILYAVDSEPAMPLYPVLYPAKKMNRDDIPAQYPPNQSPEPISGRVTFWFQRAVSGGRRDLCGPIIFYCPENAHLGRWA